MEYLLYARIHDKLGQNLVRCSPLLFALQHRKMDIAALLIDEGAGIEGNSGEGRDLRL